MGWCAESVPQPQRYTLVSAPGAEIRSLIRPIKVASDKLKSPSAIYLPESPTSYRYADYIPHEHSANTGTVQQTEHYQAYLIVSIKDT